MLSVPRGDAKDISRGSRIERTSSCRVELGGELGETVLRTSVCIELGAD